MGKYNEIMDRVNVTPEMRERVLKGVRESMMEEQEKSTQQIHNNQQGKSHQKGKIIPFANHSFGRKWRRYAGIAACFILVVVGVFAVRNLSQTSVVQPGVTTTVQNEQSDSQGDDTQTGDATAAGILEVSSLSELEASIGFDVEELTGLPFEVTEVAYVNFFDEFAQVDYRGSNGEEITYRKSVGTEDNSGNYEEFDNIVTITVNTGNADNSAAEGSTTETGAATTKEVTLKGMNSSYTGDNSGSGTQTGGQAGNQVGNQADGANSLPIYTLAVWTDGNYSYSLSSTLPMTADEWTETIEGMK